MITVTNEGSQYRNSSRNHGEKLSVLRCFLIQSRTTWPRAAATHSGLGPPASVNIKPAPTDRPTGQPSWVIPPLKLPFQVILDCVKLTQHTGIAAPPPCQHIPTHRSLPLFCGKPPGLSCMSSQSSYLNQPCLQLCFEHVRSDLEVSSLSPSLSCGNYWCLCWWPGM